jgi:hypothetical protein
MGYGAMVDLRTPETWGPDLYGDPCRGCGYRWDQPA